VQFDQRFQRMAGELQAVFHDKATVTKRLEAAEERTAKVRAAIVEADKVCTWARVRARTSVCGRA